MDLKKMFTYLLAGLVLLFTVIAILSIWDIIQVKDVMWRSVKTLMVLFLSAAIVLFVFQIAKKDS